MTPRVLLSVLLYSLLILVAVPFSALPQDEDDTKAIKAEVFIKSRPVKTSRSTARYRPTVKKSDNNADVPPPGTAFAQLGVTLWRFRRSNTSDKTKELVEEDDGQQIEWTLERIADNTLLAPGQRVRLGFESLTREGYLYIIDREEYSDGSLGEPILIYPTQKSALDYRVEPGRLVYVPSATGRFRIKPSDSAKIHVAEVLTFIVSPRPLMNENQLGHKSIKLERGLVDEWQRQWSSAATKFEMEGGNGQAMTSVEQSAGNQRSPLLSQSDPVPQTIYRLAVKPDAPVVSTIRLRFGH